MATDSRSLPAFFNTDADFQAWCQGIHAQLAAAGLVNTADTGQINNTTVTKPAAISTAQGYEIWRFADTLQATNPIFLKIEYGSAGAVDRPSLWVTTGTGTNGAGTLTGNVTTRRQVAAGVSKTAGTTLTSYCSGDGGRIALCNNYDPTSGSFPMFFTVDRLRDGSGTALAEGFVQMVESNTGSANTDTMLGATLVGGIGARWVGVFGSTGVPLGSGLTANAGNVAVMPPIVLNGRPRFLVAWCAYNGSAPDITATSTFTASALGTSHTYLTLPQVPSGIFQHSNDHVAMLWE